MIEMCDKIREASVQISLDIGTLTQYCMFDQMSSNVALQMLLLMASEGNEAHAKFFFFFFFFFFLQVLNFRYYNAYYEATNK